MKVKLKFVTSVILLFLGLSNIQAQETLPATGGKASGTGGSASYTVGQIVYTTQTGINGNTVAQGVQQPFETSVVTGIKKAQGITLEVSAYPNPTSDYLTLKVENYNTENLQYIVFDINGKLLQRVKCVGNKTSINIQNYPVANYYVKVLDSQKEIKVFKIIKN